MRKNIWKDWEDNEEDFEDYEQKPNRVNRAKTKRRERHLEVKKRKPHRSLDWKYHLASFLWVCCGIGTLESVFAKRSKTSFPPKIQAKSTIVKERAQKGTKCRGNLDWLLDSDYFTSDEENIYEEVKQPSSCPRVSTSRKPKLRKNKESPLSDSGIMSSICSLKCSEKKKRKSRPPSRQELDERISSIQKEARLSSRFSYPKYRLKKDSDSEDDHIYEEINFE